MRERGPNDENCCVTVLYGYFTMFCKMGRGDAIAGFLKDTNMKYVSIIKFTKVNI